MMISHPWQRLLLTLALLAPLALASGCGIFSPEEVDNGPGTVEPPAPFPEATTQDILIDNFVRTYNERNYTEYEELLHDDFLFYLSDEDVGASADGRFDRARDLEATFNMFDGQAGQRPDGSVQPPIQSIILELRPEGTEWTSEVAEDFLGTTMKRYEVEMDVTYTNGDVSEVTGLQEFYAVAVPKDNGDGTVRTVYELKFWRDLGKEGL